jgi:hypothetical protein
MQARSEFNDLLGFVTTGFQRSQYLAHGLPIATGIIESTCGHLIKDRMEGARMAGSVDGAEAMVRLRGVFIDEFWEGFWDFNTDSEKRRLYQR